MSESGASTVSNTVYVPCPFVTDLPVACVVLGGGKLCKDFQGEVATQIEMGTSPAAALSECRKRQHAWLQRSTAEAPKKGRSDWRPAKRFRVGSYKNMVSLDSELRTFGLPGLSHYVRDWDAERWDSWPVLTVCWDQDSTNLSAGHWLMYAKKAAIDIQWDPNHGAWNDVRGSAKEAGYLPFLLGLLLVWNLPHGPWQDDLRSTQFQEALDLPPLVAARASSLLQESGKAHLLSSPGALEQMWNEFRPANPFSKKGSNTCLNRFMSLTKQGQEELKHWSFRLAAYELVAMESGMLSGAKFQKAILGRSGVGIGSGRGYPGGHDKPKTRFGVDRALRSSCANALVMAVCLLNEPLAWRRLAQFVEITGHISRWHSQASEKCRSVSCCQMWLRHQCMGGCMNNNGCIWSSLMLPASVARQGFWTPHQDRDAPSPATTCMEDGLAEEVGTLALSLIRLRLIRTLPLTSGWPNCAGRLLEDPQSAEAEAGRILGCFVAFERLKASQGEHDFLRSLVNRSLFQRPVVLMLVKGLQESRGAISQRLRDVLSRHLNKCTSTTVIEDCFNSMKKRQGVHSAEEEEPCRARHVSGG